MIVVVWVQIFSRGIWCVCVCVCVCVCFFLRLGFWVCDFSGWATLNETAPQDFEIQTKSEAKHLKNTTKMFMPAQLPKKYSPAVLFTVLRPRCQTQFQNFFSQRDLEAWPRWLIHLREFLKSTARTVRNSAKCSSLVQPNQRDLLPALFPALLCSRQCSGTSQHFSVAGT